MGNQSVSSSSRNYPKESQFPNHQRIRFVEDRGSRNTVENNNDEEQQKGMVNAHLLIEFIFVKMPR